MVEVGRFDARKDAESARSLLAVAKIPCVLVPDQGPDHPDSISGRARILVADADADDAAAILRRYTTTDWDDGSR